jgi:enamine deaminase RidA (YjgF/YER057c/UK114 family)
MRSFPCPGALPSPPDPVGAYRPVVIRGGMGFVSGQFPIEQGEMRFAGTADRLDREALRAAARLAARNVCAQIERALGDWRGFVGLCRVDGIVAAGPGFTGHAAVLDAASETFVALLGSELGAHTRSASSAPALPGNACLELVVSFAVERA